MHEFTISMHSPALNRHYAMPICKWDISLKRIEFLETRLFGKLTVAHLIRRFIAFYGKRRPLLTFTITDQQNLILTSSDLCSSTYASRYKYSEKTTPYKNDTSYAQHTLYRRPYGLQVMKYKKANVRTNATTRRVRGTTVAVEKQ